MKSFDPDEETPFVDALPDEGVQLDDDVIAVDAERAIDLLDPVRLLGGRDGDLFHHVGHALHGQRNLAHRRPGTGHQSGTGVDSRHRTTDQAFDFLGGGR